MKAIVIPSNRLDEVKKRIGNWIEASQCDMVVLMVDSMAAEEAIRGGIMKIETRVPVKVRFIEDIQRWPHASLIQVGSSAIRSFGFISAVELGATEILTIDDDCLLMPLADGWFKSHEKACRVDRFASSCHDLVARGTPYKQVETLCSGFNIGLWNGIPDQDAVHTLALPRKNYVARTRTVVVPPRQYVPMCGMNVWFQAWWLPAIYFPVLPYPRCRFDDIWAGLILKKVADMLGIPFCVGGPAVQHERLSDPFRNLSDEADGIRMHEEIWDLVMSAGVVAPMATHPSLRLAALVAATVRTLAAEVAEDSQACSQDVREYVPVWMDALQRWSQVTESMLVGSPSEA